RPRSSRLRASGWSGASRAHDAVRTGARSSAARLLRGPALDGAGPARRMRRVVTGPRTRARARGGRDARAAAESEARPTRASDAEDLERLYRLETLCERLASSP